jgi:hypothetical protein
MILSKRLFQSVPALGKRWASSASGIEAYTVSEVQIPAMEGNYIAGKCTYKNFYFQRYSIHLLNRIFKI